MFPFDLSNDANKWLGYLVYFIIGGLFGSVLEVAGFGDSRKLAAQFYLKDMTVLKTMFTAILVAMLLIFFSSAIGFIDFSKVIVTETYLWPGIIGGLILGVGFIVGGYCPGTSVVSAASLKLDGIIFLIGTMLGAALFGESLTLWGDFWYSSFSERLLLCDWLGWSLGSTVLAVTLLALMMFYCAEKIESYLNRKETNVQFRWFPQKRGYIIGGSVALFIAVMILIIGQPTPDRKWNLIKAQYEAQISGRDIFIHPLEYVKAWNSASVKLVTLDLRSAEEFQKFHLESTKNVTFQDLNSDTFIGPLLKLPTQGVVIVIANSDEVAIKGWKWLKAQGVNNLYILDGGIENWLKLFSDKVIPDESFDLSRPPLKILDQFPTDTYKTKIILKSNKKAGGLCG